jgi:hypothetical protein
MAEPFRDLAISQTVLILLFVRPPCWSLRVGVVLRREGPSPLLFPRAAGQLPRKDPERKLLSFLILLARRPRTAGQRRIPAGLYTWCLHIWGGPYLVGGQGGCPACPHPGPGLSAAPISLLLIFFPWPRGVHRAGGRMASTVRPSLMQFIST